MEEKVVVNLQTSDLESANKAAHELSRNLSKIIGKYSKVEEIKLSACDAKDALIRFVIRVADDELATPEQLDAMARVASSLGITV